MAQQHMLKTICGIILIVVIGISTSYAYSQEIGLATFQESAQLIIDNKTSEKNMASITLLSTCLLYTSPSPRDGLLSRMPSSA